MYAAVADSPHVRALLQFILEEKFLAKYRMQPLLAVGLEGAWGVVLSLCALPLLCHIEVKCVCVCVCVCVCALLLLCHNEVKCVWVCVHCCCCATLR